MHSKAQSSSPSIAPLSGPCSAIHAFASAISRAHLATLWLSLAVGLALDSSLVTRDTFFVAAGGPHDVVSCFKALSDPAVGASHTGNAPAMPRAVAM